MQSKLLIGETQAVTGTFQSHESLLLNSASIPRAAESSVPVPRRVNNDTLAAPVRRPVGARTSSDRIHLPFALLPYAIPFAGVGAIGCCLFLWSEKLVSYGLMTTLAGCALGGLAQDDE